jgi:hypothetical protein
MKRFSLPGVACLAMLAGGSDVVAASGAPQQPFELKAVRAKKPPIIDGT